MSPKIFFVYIRGVIGIECEFIQQIWWNKVTEVPNSLQERYECLIPVFRNRLTWNPILQWQLSRTGLAYQIQHLFMNLQRPLFCFILFKNTLRGLRMWTVVNFLNFLWFFRFFIFFPAASSTSSSWQCRRRTPWHLLLGQFRKMKKKYFVRLFFFFFSDFFLFVWFFPIFKNKIKDCCEE